MLVVGPWVVVFVAVGTEVDGLFEQAIRDARHFLVSNWPLFVEEFRVAWEIAEAEVDVDPGFGSLAERSRHLIVAGCTVANGVHVVDRRFVTEAGAVEGCGHPCGPAAKDDAIVLVSV